MGSSPGSELVKKSETPQWDDLGWAWGKKRSDASFHGPPVQDSEQPQTSRVCILGPVYISYHY